MKILMCRPDYYGIEYEINPWMDINHTVNHQVARAQWEFLYETIKQCGADVELVPAEKGWPDMVFTANAGLYFKDKIILSQFKHKERQGETPYFEKWFIENDYSLINDEAAGSFEGAGDALPANDKLFAGFGFRTDKSFYAKTPFLQDQHLVFCELANPYFYHLDTCFCPLTDDLAMWYPNAFSSESQKNMAKAIDLIAINEAEAKRFACNAVVLDKKVIVPTGCPSITVTLKEAGFEVYACEMDEYLKAGGACKCLTLRLD